MCADSWNINDANVACRQLGYHHAARAFNSPYLGVGLPWKSVYIDNVQCYGNEVSLADCFSSPWGMNECGVYTDAAVNCFGKI